MMYKSDKHKSIPSSLELRAKLARANNLHGFWSGIKFAAFGVAVSFGVLPEMWTGVFDNLGLTFTAVVISAGLILGLSCFGMIKGLKRTATLEEEIADTARELQEAELSEKDNQA